MKYFLTLIIGLLIMSACDDGDLITTDINLDSNSNVLKCSDSNTLYKINGTESLILNISDTNFPNVVTEPNKPRVIVLGTEATASYRKYSGAVITGSICSNPAPANPVVQEEWTINGGTVEITTTQVFDSNMPTKIIAYNHFIAFKNVTFVSSGKEIVYTNREFGNYRTDVVALPFAFSTSQTQKCDTKNLLFKYNNDEVLLFELDPALFSNVVGIKEALINTASNGYSNTVTYRKYSANLSVDFFCANITPVFPTLLQEWNSISGVAATSGIIRVETTGLTTNTFEHTIKLYKTTFKNGIKEFSPNPDGEYIFGTYKTTK